MHHNKNRKVCLSLLNGAFFVIRSITFEALFEVRSRATKGPPSDLSFDRTLGDREAEPLDKMVEGEGKKEGLIATVK
jgi:hypothetical protein